MNGSKNVTSSNKEDINASMPGKGIDVQNQDKEKIDRESLNSQTKK